MALTAKILFQFILVMNAHIAAKWFFDRLAKVIEAASDIIHKCVKSIVIAILDQVKRALLSLTTKFLHKGTTTDCFSRSICINIPRSIAAMLTGCCNCIERKLFTAAGVELRGTSNEGRGTINLPQIPEVCREKKGVGFQDVSFKFLHKLSNLSHGGQRGQIVLRVKRDEGRETISSPRINTNKHFLKLSFLRHGLTPINTDRTCQSYKSSQKLNTSFIRRAAQIIADIIINEYNSY